MTPTAQMFASACEDTWLHSDEPLALFELLGAERALSARGSERKLRLFACACVRRVWSRLHLGEYTRLTRAGMMIENHADARGGCAWHGLDDARAIAIKTLLATPVDSLDHAAATVLHMASDHAIAHVRDWLTGVLSWIDKLDVPAADQADTIRDLFGNPFRLRSVAVTAGWLSGPAYDGSGAEPCCPHYALEWAPVRQLAREIYHQRDFRRLCDLHVLLERSGCECAELLAHLRGDDGVRHRRGCWALDLILGY